MLAHLGNPQGAPVRHAAPPSSKGGPTGDADQGAGREGEEQAPRLCSAQLPEMRCRPRRPVTAGAGHLQRQPTTSGKQELIHKREGERGGDSASLLHPIPFFYLS